MAAGETLMRHARPLLDDGETIARVFPASSGLNPLYGIALLSAGMFLSFMDVFPWSLLLLGLAVALLLTVRNLVVAVTDRAVVVMASGMFLSFRARHVEVRLPPDTPLGPLRGRLWANATGLSAALGRTVSVHRRFHRLVEGRV